MQRFWLKLTERDIIFDPEQESYKNCTIEKTERALYILMKMVYTTTVSV